MTFEWYKIYIKKKIKNKDKKRIFTLIIVYAY